MEDGNLYQVLYRNNDFKVIMSHLTKTIFIISLKSELDNRVSVYHQEDESIEVLSESNFKPIHGGFEVRRD